MQQSSHIKSEAVLHWCFQKEVFWKHAARLQENTHVEVWFQQKCFVTLLKAHFGMVFSSKFATYFQLTFS